MTTTERLLNVSKEIWEAYHEHPFVKGIADDSLDKEKFKYYMIQDYLYLIDYTIMNEQLCRWIADELEMQDLAVKLVELIRNHGSVEKFVVLVLHESRIYTPGEMAHIQNVLEKLKNQKEVERQKYKADKLMESGELESAILVYMSIVNGEKDDSVDKRFYGRVSACLAGAYGRAFLYEESARMYEKAYKICEDNKSKTSRILLRSAQVHRNDGKRVC